MDPDELLALEGPMRGPDAIMEPGMADLVGRYIRAGGKPEHVIESLTTSYEGFAQMASLVCSWAKLVDAPYAPPGTTAGGSGAFDAPAAPAAPGGGGGGTGGGGGGRRGGMPLDEFTLLQELARERFDPERLLAVFRSSRPTWLHELTADARGRRLVLDLSAEHRSSIFLNYAMRRIFDGGHDDEVAAVGSSLSSYFEVYHRLLARRLEAAAAAASPAALARVSAELAEACAGSQHTYAHAQLLLSHLHARSAAAAASSSGDAGGAGGGGDAGGSGGGGGAFRRLSQDLEAAAAARHGGAAVWAMQPLFVPRGAGPGAREAVRLVSRALVLGAGGGAAGGAGVTQVSQLLAQLQELYARGPGPDLPLEPLRHSRFLQMLLEGLFSWQQPPSEQAQRTATQLLALAAAGAGPDAPARAADAAARLAAARALAGRAARGEKLGGDELAEAAAAAGALPMAGLGLLHFASDVLGCSSYYDDDRCGASAPQLLALLRAAGGSHPARAAGAVRALGGALAAMGVRRQELAERVIGELVEHLLAGHAARVLAAAGAWASGGADPSLVRAFVLRVLARAGPPFSRGFARPLVRLTAAGKFGNAKRTGALAAGGGAAERLREFAVECLEGGDLGLSDDEEACLLALAT